MRAGTAMVLARFVIQVVATSNADGLLLAP